MKNVSSKYQLKKLKSYPKEVLGVIKNTLNVLDENYGIGRDIKGDLGGYIIVVETMVDVEEIRESILKGTVPEYTNVIEVVNGENYTLSLYLLSSDYAIVVVTTEEISKLLLE